MKNLIDLAFITYFLFIPLLTITGGILVFLTWRRSENSAERIVAWFALISPIVFIAFYLLILVLNPEDIYFESFDIPAIGPVVILSFSPVMDFRAILIGNILTLILLLFVFEGLLLFIALRKDDNKRKRVIAWSGLLLPVPIATFTCITLSIVTLSYVGNG